MADSTNKPEDKQTETADTETTATAPTDSVEQAAASEQAETADAKATEEVDAASALEAIKKDLEAQKNLVQESDERYKRLQADFTNFRRRNDKEREDLSAVVLQGLIKDLLPIVDNFERALAVEKAQGDALYDGILMVYKQLMASLEKNGLEYIKAVDEKFDPNFHQAVMRVQDESKEDDTIAEELQKGYMVHGRVIRPSMVKVVAN